MPDASLSGSQRAAVLLMAMGEHEAAEVLKHMEPKEVQALGTAMTALSNITQDQISEVLDEFMGTVRNQSSLGFESQDYLKNVLNKALGKEKAGNVLPRILMSNSPKGLETLKWMAPRAIANVIAKEHPQIIAIVLIYLEADAAGEVLALLPEAVRGDVLMRIATLDGVQPSALKELDEIMENLFAGSGDTMVSNIGGTKSAADILNSVHPTVEAAIMEKINEANSELGEEIQELMFTFESLNDIDDRGIQALLREVSSDSLVIALKGAEPETREKIFKNMSTRAAEMLREDLESKGPVRLSEVDAAQKDVLNVLHRMAEDGQIMLGGKGEDFV